MKAKDLITELSKLDPETEVYTHMFDTYVVTKNFEIKNVFRNHEGDVDDPICFVDEWDEDFQISIVLLTDRKTNLRKV